MIRVVLIIFCCVFSLFARNEQKNLQGLEKVIEQGLEDFQVPGLAVAIVDANGFSYVKGFGVRDLENRLPVTGDTLFPIASCSKAFASFVFGCLVDEGKLGWDQYVVDLIGEFKMVDCDVTQLATFRDLFAHRIGLPRHDYVWYNAALTRDDLIERMRFLSPSCGFRERFEYNNFAYLVAGMAMERVTGKNWETLVREKILDPLGMKRTNFSISALKDSSDFSWPYIEKEGIKRMAHRDVSIVGPAACINSSASDMCRWIQMLLNCGYSDGRFCIAPSTLSETFSAQPYTASKETIGLGWRIDEFRGYKQVAHDGVIDGFTSLVALLPERGIGVVILTNRNNNPLPRLLSMHIFERMLGLDQKDWLKEGREVLENEKKVQLLEREKDLQPKKKADPTHSLEEYTGEYVHPAYGALDVELVDGGLQLLFNRFVFRLEPWVYDHFRICSESEEMIISQVGKKVNFRTNLDGKIDELQIAFDPESGPVIFKFHSKEKEPLKCSCLNRYVGQYQIYHKVIDIVIEEGVLKALIPGGGPYELIPEGEGEFLVKGQNGRKVHFVLNENGKVKEVFLREPHGTVYTAKPKN